jgi:hypothetical protein
MKRFFLTIAAALALLPILLATADGGPISAIAPVRGSDYGVRLDMWTNKAQNDIYHPGELVTVHFRASDDCFVTIYSISPEGDVSIIFPEFPDDGFVYGGVTYRLPDYYSGMRLRVTGPRGIGYLHGVATRDAGAFLYTARHGRWHPGVTPIVGDPFMAMNTINAHLIQDRHIDATATVSYFVGGRVWYPRYACYDCHGRTSVFDPYDAVCSRYTVSLARNYDYWWSYDYHPVRTRFVFAGPFWSFTLRTSPPIRSIRYRYIDCAYGYVNYVPLRPIIRPHTYVVYRPERVSTLRSWERSYTRVRVDDTWKQRSRDPRVEYRTRDYTVSRDGSLVTRSSTTSSGRSNRSVSGVDRIDTDSQGSRSRNATSGSRSRNSATDEDVQRLRASDTPPSGNSTGPASGRERSRQETTATPRSGGTRSGNDRDRQFVTPPATSTDSRSRDAHNTPSLRIPESASELPATDSRARQGIGTPDAGTETRSTGRTRQDDTRLSTQPRMESIQNTAPRQTNPTTRTPASEARPTMDIRGRDRNTGSGSTGAQERTMNNTRSSRGSSFERGNATSGRSRGDEAGSGRTGSSSHSSDRERSRSR